MAGGEGIDPKGFDYLYLGYTIHQRQAFYGAPWVAALIGAEGAPGANVSQACSTATTCLYYAAAGVENGLYNSVFNLTTDRCSNGPHIVWPNPNGRAESSSTRTGSWTTSATTRWPRTP